jgi:M6 family metalloprotease-like protein
LWLVVPLLVAAVFPLAGQTPRAKVGQFEVPGLDFTPDGAWRKEARAVRDRRHAFMRAGNLQALNSPIAGMNLISGTYNIPVIPVDFPDAAAPFPAAQYTGVLFGAGGAGQPYTTNYYYHELSNGNVTISGTVHEWVMADSADTYYEDNCNGIAINNSCDHGGATGVARFASLLTEILAKVDDGTFNWAPFDKDGDGFVDFVTFLQADQDGACGPTNTNKHIWAHRFNLADLTRQPPYQTKTPWPGHAGQFIKVNDYIIQSAQGGSTACQTGQIMPIGIITHETGHAFGLPDLYDVGGPTEGVGEWSLMGSGGYTRAYSPARYDAWSAAELGWISVDTLSSSATVDLGPVQTTDSIRYISVAGTDEYFYLENRANLESDTAQMNPVMGSRQKLPGLLIWHLDQGQIDAHGITADNKVNDGPVHGVELVQADGLGNLDATGGTSNRGDAGDSYPGSTHNRRFSYTTNPAAKSNTNAAVGWIIDSISDPDGAKRMHFRFIKGPPTFVHPSPATATIKVNGIAMASFADIESLGDTLALDADSVQFFNSNRTRYEFRTWSDGGAKVHTHHANGTAENITANFAAFNRVLLNSVVGAGSVTASVGGTLTTPGIYVASGTPVTLTAVADSGEVFGSWTGDTTSASATLVLPMARGYNVTATFTGAVVVATADAVAEILGTPTLSQAQITFLDRTGNNNGTYDLGDFLSYLRRTGAPVPPAIKRLMKATSTRKEH